MPPSAGIIDFAFHPPLGLLSPIDGAFGPYTGNGTLTAFGGRAVSNTYGVLVTLAAIPAGYGYTVGWVSDDANSNADVYEDVMAQLVVQHQLASGAWVTTQLVNVRNTLTPVLWDVALPGRLGYYTLPGVEIDLLPLLVVA